MPIEDVGALARARANTVRHPPPTAPLPPTLGGAPRTSRGRPLPIGRALPNTKTAPIGLQPVSCPAGETRPADRTACPAGVLCTLGQSVRWPSVHSRSGPGSGRPGGFASRRPRFQGVAVQGGGPENALQPRHARPLQEFLRNNARSALQRPPFPLRGGDIRRLDARGLRALRVLAPQLGSTTTLPPPPRRGAPLKRGSRIHDHSGPAGFTRFGGSPGEISRTKRAGEGVIARRSPIGAEDRRCAGVRRSTTEKEAGDALRA